MGKCYLIFGAVTLSMAKINNFRSHPKIQRKTRIQLDASEDDDFVARGGTQTKNTTRLRSQESNSNLAQSFGEGHVMVALF